MNQRSGDVAVASLPVRRLSRADLPACIELSSDRGWSAQQDNWRLLFAVSEVYGVDDPAGGLAGTVVLTRYGNDLAAVGMMVVGTRHGRQGLGTRLMTHVLERAGDAVVFLFATDLGRPLYAKLGFRVVDTSTRYVGMFRPGLAAGPAPDQHLVRLAAAADLPGLALADRPVFGADRSQLLAELVTIADRVAECGQPVRGYGATWFDGTIRILGPVVADGLPAAKALVASLAEGWAGPVRLDLLGRHRELADWAQERGLRAGASNALMTRGGSLPGERARLFAPANIAIG